MNPHFPIRTPQSAIRNPQPALIRFALGSLRRRLGRNLSLITALALVTFGYAAVLLFTEALRHEHHTAATALPDLTVQRLVAGRPALIPTQHVAWIRSLPGVARVQPRVWGYFFVPNLAGNFTVAGLDPRRPAAGLTEWGQLVRGRPPAADSLEEVVLGEALALFLGLDLGDAMTLPLGDRTVRFQVVGLFRADLALWTADLLLVNEPAARHCLRVPADACTDLAVHLTTPDEAVVVARNLGERLPDARVIDRQLLGRVYDLTFDTRAGLLAAALLPAVLALLALAWDRLSGVGPAEAREMGVLKAVGWSPAEIIAARMWEHGVLAGVGALLGLLGAYVYVFPAGAPGLAPVLLGWSSIYPRFDLAPALNVTQGLCLVGLVVIPFVAAAVIPTWRTAVRDPQQLLRGTAA